MLKLLFIIINQIKVLLFKTQHVDGDELKI